MDIWISLGAFLVCGLVLLLMSYQVFVMGHIQVSNVLVITLMILYVLPALQSGA